MLKHDCSSASWFLFNDVCFNVGRLQWRIKEWSHNWSVSRAAPFNQSALHFHSFVTSKLPNYSLLVSAGNILIIKNIPMSGIMSLLHQKQRGQEETGVSEPCVISLITWIEWKTACYTPTSKAIVWCWPAGCDKSVIKTASSLIKQKHLLGDSRSGQI